MSADIHIPPEKTTDRRSLGKNSVRKALFSAMVAGGVGHEIGPGALLEHGSNAFLPLGPLSIVPLEVVMGKARTFLKDIHHDAGVDLLLAQLAGVRDDTNADITEDDKSPFEFDRLPGMAAFGVPSPEEYAMVEALACKLMRPGAFVCLPEPVLRLAILILVAWSGLPLTNLISYRNYYQRNSFLVARDALHLVAVLPQADLGLGLVPISLEECQQAVLGCLRSLDPTRRDLFYRLELNAGSTGLRIARLCQSLGVQAMFPSEPKWFFRALSRVSVFRSLCKFGGLMTAGLCSRLLVPPNYYHIVDLLNAACDNMAPPQDISGGLWQNPYNPSITDRENRLDSHGMVRLALDGFLVRGGRPRKLAIQGAPQEWDNRSFAKFFSLYDCWPSNHRIAAVVAEVTKCNQEEAQRRATGIYRVIRKNGWLHCGRPLRLLPSGRMEVFLRNHVFPKLGTMDDGNADIAERRKGIVLSAAALGTRLAESLRHYAVDYEATGAWEQIFVRGTKTRSSARDIPLDDVRIGPEGHTLVSMLLDVWNERAAKVGNENPLFAFSAKESAKRASTPLGKILNDAFREFRPLPSELESGCRRVDGAFTYYELRHAAFVRTLQGVIDEDLARGNFLVRLAQTTANFGHSIFTGLCSYLGTASAAIHYK